MVIFGFTSTVKGTSSASGYRGLACTPKITTRCPTPIWGAASPAPFLAAMVSFMSWRSDFSSGPNCSTGFARSRSTGCPILNTSRTAMFPHESGDDAAHVAHRLVDHLADVLQRDA